MTATTTYSMPSANAFGPAWLVMTVASSLLTALIVSKTGIAVMTLAKAVQIGGMMMTLSAIAIGSIMKPDQIIDDSLSIDELIRQNILAMHRYMMTVFFYATSGILLNIIATVAASDL